MFDDDEDSGDGTGPGFFCSPPSPKGVISDGNDEPATKTFVVYDSEYDDDNQLATKSFSTDPDEVKSNVTAEQSNSDGHVEVV
jgi:hypothetical protein